jgi:sarcosine oxidase subunit gamma
MADTSITEPAPRAAAGIAGFRNRDRFIEAMRAEFGTDIPTSPRFIQSGDVTLSCLGPARYLATAPKTVDLHGRLSKALDGIAAITEQSDLWTLFALSGEHVRDTLARVVPIDLDPAKFRVGDLALTRGGHLDVRLWRLGDESYEIAVARSYKEDLRHLMG